MHIWIYLCSSELTLFEYTKMSNRTYNYIALNYILNWVVYFYVSVINDHKCKVPIFVLCSVVILIQIVN